ncbi:hypothetical protein DICVIV_05122 [Dictyocaulus viviparus]|uniref:Ras family protein n=1 Tax=Dictyocaulus viviparus TaxID=29172 RepID=A0A0D8XVT9_DICVI|nr:hypothetical protein DICVIV_05122 [Dictyocaulus viviparus]
MKLNIRKRSSIYHEVDHSFTVMLLGDSCTGKTCLLVRYKDGAFLSNNFISTVGIDYRNKVIDIDNKKVKLQVIFFRMILKKLSSHETEY